MPIWDRVLFPVMLPTRLRALPTNWRPDSKVKPFAAMAAPEVYIENIEMAALSGSLFSP
jgi:hypothetical protein